MYVNIPNNNVIECSIVHFHPGHEQPVEEIVRSDLSCHGHVHRYPIFIVVSFSEFHSLTLSDRQAESNGASKVVSKNFISVPPDYI